MIRSESEYRHTLKEIQAREQQRAELNQNYVEQGLDSDTIQRLLDPLECFLLDLKEEAQEYQELKQGKLGKFMDLRHLGKYLIKLRIARGLTQRQLAELLNVKESLVSRDEHNEYHGITVERAMKIIEVLHGNFRGQVRLQRTARQSIPKPTAQVSASPHRKKVSV